MAQGTVASSSPAESYENVKVLIKWWGLPYDACTWESVDVHPDLPKLLERYRAWTKSSVADAMNDEVNGSVAAARAVALLKSHSRSAGNGVRDSSVSGSGASEEKTKTDSGEGAGSDGGGSGWERNGVGAVGGSKPDDGLPGKPAHVRLVGGGGSGSGGSPDVSDTDAGVTDTTDTVAGALRRAREPEGRHGRRHRAGSASSSSDPAVRWLLSAWMHREGA